MLMFCQDVSLNRCGCQPHTQPSTWRTRVSLLVWVFTFHVSDMGGSTSSYVTSRIALRNFWPHKPHHYIKVGIPSVGHLIYYLCIICHLFPFSTVLIGYWYVLFNVYEIAAFSCSIEWDMLFGIIASFEVGQIDQQWMKNNWQIGWHSAG